MILKSRQTSREYTICETRDGVFFHVNRFTGEVKMNTTGEFDNSPFETPDTETIIELMLMMTRNFLYEDNPWIEAIKSYYPDVYKYFYDNSEIVIVGFDSYRDGGTMVFSCSNGEKYRINFAIAEEDKHGEVNNGKTDVLRVKQLISAIEIMNDHNIDFYNRTNDGRRALFYGRHRAIEGIRKFYGDKLL